MCTTARIHNPFPLGQTVVTPGALEALAASTDTAAALLARHAAGDWGDVPPEDAAANDRGTFAGDRVLSAYVLSTGVRLWVITEADRSVTTLLLPEEY
jgi:hypothetical protein